MASRCDGTVINARPRSTIGVRFEGTGRVTALDAVEHDRSGLSSK
ncbi:hypothetical protein [Natronobacterium gregoryi]|nr:hypothetical protein [Natronobacterium gregoryi]